MSPYGYGQILEVDLSAGNIKKRDVDSRFAQEFIGGMGFSCKMLYDEVGADVDPLGPDNIVIFANGPLTGTHAPCGGRTEITTKSPLTGHIGTGNTGGLWGASLKHAGFDMIVVRKQAEKPVYLWIDDGVAEIREAGHLWGKDTQATSDILRQELGSSPGAQVSVLAIGQAGENLVRYACPLNDYHHAAARGGAGAVMGSKKVKAIAVRGTGTTKIAHPEEFGEAAKEARQRLMASRGLPRTSGASSDARRRYLEQGCLRAKNYQTGVLPHFLETRGQDMAMKYFTKKEATCYACPIPCFNLGEVKEGKYAGTKVNRVQMAGFVCDWGAKCAIDNLPAIFRCKELCQQLGMDYVTASGSISFAMELFQRGIITTKDTDGLELSWGNEEATIKMLRKIAFREGFGDVLAEGSLRAARIIGKGAEYYSMTIKGLELMAPDPRSCSKSTFLGFITNPRGGDDLKSTHGSGADRYNPNWWVDEFDMFEDVKEKIYGMPPQEFSSIWEGKALYCRWYEDLRSILNTLGVCLYASGNLVLGPTYLAKLFSTCTGWDTTPQDIMKFGEKSFTLLKAYTARQGLTRKDDFWPERFYTETLPEGPAQGAILSRDTTEQLLDEYYGLRGWDKTSGIPTREKLIQLGLPEIADELHR